MSAFSLSLHASLETQTPFPPKHHVAKWMQPCFIGSVRFLDHASSHLLWDLNLRITSFSSIFPFLLKLLLFSLSLFHPKDAPMAPLATSHFLPVDSSEGSADFFNSYSSSANGSQGQPTFLGSLCSHQGPQIAHLGPLCLSFLVALTLPTLQGLLSHGLQNITPIMLISLYWSLSQVNLS